MTKTIIIVGLGNPGLQYDETRHNFGFMAIDKFADLHKIDIKQKKGSFIFGSGNIRDRAGNNVEIVLVKPLCYMNNSGVAVKAILKQYELEPDSLLVVYDDIDMPLGKVRIRPRGSSGGHRGIESIINKISTKEYNRLKLGIGDQPKGKASEDFVLEEFTKREMKIVDDVLEQSISVIEDFALFEITQMMQKYNGYVVTQLKLGEELK
jgi:PTH1 family peptidyl-tRNA hydrolase